MRRILVFSAALLIVLGSCQSFGFRRVKGNGHLAVVERKVQQAKRIALSGSMDVQLTQGPETSVKIEADDNIIPHILTQDEDGVLRIRPRKNNTSFTSEHDIVVYITTPTLESVQINGSGSVMGKTKFSGSDNLSLRISGSGDIDLDVNTPEAKSEISGSGNITLRGETQRQSVQITGFGKYMGDGLKSENATVRITGSGDVRLFADATLDIHITGSGSVAYKGSPAVTQKIVGGGEIKRIDQ